MARPYWALAVMTLLAACQAGPGIGLKDGEAAAMTGGFLYHPGNTIQDDWLHVPLRGETDYQLDVFAGSVAIRARGRDSASGLIRRVAVDTALCPEIEWQWHVGALQASANLYEKDGDDVGAALFLLFGDPGLASNPQPVPTLRYVWTTDHVAPNTIIDNPYMKGTVKSIIVRNGVATNGAWVADRRNLVEDYLAAYGELPGDKIRAVMLFTDNDQTKEPVEAHYGWAKVHCSVDGLSFEEEIGWD